MIAFVRGRVTAIFVDSAVIDVGGVGILVMCTPPALADLTVGAQATLTTSMVVREDSLTLFGFADYDERSVFELLQTASGVGPKLAQATLAVLGAEELRRAIIAEDLLSLCKVPGIGRKGAQRMVLELKDRISGPSSPSTGRSAMPHPRHDEWQPQVRAGLLGLGWSAREADTAVATVAPMAAETLSDGEPIDISGLLRAALRSLSRA